MNKTIQDLIDEITSADTIIDGATVFVNGVPGLINTAVQQALANGATAAQIQPVTDLAALMTTKAAALNAAILANTPSAPAA
jgi:hypothetical protein